MVKIALSKKGITQQNIIPLNSRQKAEDTARFMHLEWGREKGEQPPP